MPTVPVLDAAGTSRGSLELSADVFGGPVRLSLVHQGVVREQAARRAGTHATRGRSEVSGGGRKPWRQKGTGRARQGSIRATQWKGGGKPFGPKPRSYDKRMPVAMRRAALRAAMAAKVSAGAVTVIERLALAEPKTKALLTRLAGWGVKASPTLLVVSERGDTLARAARNVPWLVVETPGHVSLYQVVRSGRLLFEQEALLALQAALSAGAGRRAPQGADRATRSAGGR